MMVSIKTDQCPLCESNLIRQLLNKSGLELWQCNNCGVHFRVMESTQSKDHFLDIDMEAYNNSVRKTREDSYQTLITRITPHVKTGKWLDVGCSFGWLLDFVTEAGFSGYGVDPSPTATQAAEGKPFVIMTGLYPETDGGGSPYQVVSFMDVLEHMADPVHVLNKTHAVLEQDGILVIQLPDRASLMYKLGFLLFRLGLLEPLKRLYLFDFDFPHLYYFNKKSLTTLLQKTGYTVVELERIPLGRIVDTFRRISYDGKSRGKRATAMLVMGTIFTMMVGRITGRTGMLRVLARPSRDQRQQTAQ